MQKTSNSPSGTYINKKLKLDTGNIVENVT